MPYDFARERYECRDLQHDYDLERQEYIRDGYDAVPDDEDEEVPDGEAD